MLVPELLAGLWLLCGLVTFALCVAAARGDRINAAAQERQSRAELYPAHRQENVSNVCWANPKYGECATWAGEDE